MQGRYILFTLVLVHSGLLLREYIGETGSCKNLSLPAQHLKDDVFTVDDRLAIAAQFHVVSVCEILLMALVLMAGFVRDKRSAYALSDGQIPYLSFSMLVFPALILVGVVSVRMRHTGVFGCAHGDDQCCDNMYCPDTASTTYSELPGCNLGGGYRAANVNSPGTGAINWNDRSSYCVVPSWYHSPLPIECGGLLRLPDTSACYQYGCSYDTTPVPYVSVRLIMANAILFVIVSVHSSL